MMELGIVPTDGGTANHHCCCGGASVHDGPARLRAKDRHMQGLVVHVETIQTDAVPQANQPLTPFQSQNVGPLLLWHLDHARGRHGSAGYAWALRGLILTLARTDVHTLSVRFRSNTPVRSIGASLVLVAAGLSIAWMSMWAAHIFAGRPTPGEPEEFKLVAAGDLTIMAPALASEGVLLWRRHPWGCVIASVAGLQGSLYLLVLTVNSAVFISPWYGDCAKRAPRGGRPRAHHCCGHGTIVRECSGAVAQ